MTKLSAETRELLKHISTATLATALYKRGFRQQAIQASLRWVIWLIAWLARPSRFATCLHAKTLMVLKFFAILSIRSARPLKPAHLALCW